MTVLAKHQDLTAHIGAPITALASLPPLNKGKQNPILYIVNMFLPFLKVKEKDNWRYLVLTREALHFLIVGEDELFEKRVFPLGEIQNFTATQGQHQWEIAFDHGGQRHAFTALEYPFGAMGVSQDEYAQYAQMTRQLVDALRGE